MSVSPTGSNPTITNPPTPESKRAILLSPSAPAWAKNLTFSGDLPQEVQYVTLPVTRQVVPIEQISIVSRPSFESRSQLRRQQLTITSKEDYKTPENTAFDESQK